MRRSFLGVLASLVAVLLVAVACGDDATPAPQIVEVTKEVEITKEVPVPQTVVVIVTPTPTPGPAAGSPVVNRLKVAVSIERFGNDPVLITDMAPQFLPAYEALVRYDEDGVYVPMLAESWSFGPDLKEWTFKLQKGVQWHKGFGEFTAADVLHTAVRHGREESMSIHTGFFKDSVVPNTEIVDDYTINFHLPATQIDTHIIVSNRWFNLIMSKAQFDQGGQAGVEADLVGTNAYQLKETEQGARNLFESVPYEHYRVTPDFPELELLFSTEHAVRLAMLLTDGAHMTRIPPDLESTALAGGMVQIFGTTPTLSLHTDFGGLFFKDIPEGSVRKGEHPDLPYSDVFHDVDEVPWVHVKVRKALNHAIDRQEILDTLLAGNGERMPVAQFHPSLRGWDTRWETDYENHYGYNPELAKQLLKEVEDELGHPLDWSQTVYPVFTKPELPQLQDIAEAIAAMWAEVGVNIRVEEPEFSVFVGRVFDGTLGGMVRTNANDPFPDPFQVIVYYNSVNGFCCPFYENKVVDDLIEQLKPETDFDKRDEILREIGNIVYDDYAMAPLFWLLPSFVINPNVVADYTTTGIRGLRDLEHVTAMKN